MCKPWDRRRSRVPRDPRWLSASDLAEYAYCPRAAHYHRRFPEAPAGPEAAAGIAYHERVLGRERRTEEHGTAYWAGAVVGALLVLVGLLALVRA